MAQLTQLESRLRRDNQGDVRDNLLAELQAAGQQLYQSLAHSQGEQRQQIAQLLTACASSAEVITLLWDRYHRK